MSTNSFLAKFLRFIGIALMGLTAAFTLLGGAGTTCVAINPTGFGESMAPLAKFQWLMKAASSMAAGKALVAGAAVGGLHIYVSRLLRGKSMPVDAVVYTTILTLVVFLIFRIPGIWRGVNFDKGFNNGNTGGLAASITLILVGVSVLALPFMMTETHTFVAGGINWAATWSLPLNLIGFLLIVDGLGCFTFIIIFRERYYRQNASLVSRTYQTLDNPTPLPLILELRSELTRNCANLVKKTQFCAKICSCKIRECGSIKNAQ